MNDGRILNEKLTSGGTTTRSNHYQYYASGPFVGLLQTVTDGRGTTRSNSYEDYLRLAAVTTTGTDEEQKTTSTYQFDRRGLLTRLSQSFNSPSAGAGTTLNRTHNGYGRVVSESLSINGEQFIAISQNWDNGGRRTWLGLPRSQVTTFGYRADGLMTSVGTSTFGYGDNGLLTGRTNNSRTYTVNQRDGNGRILQTSTKIGLQSVMLENLSWRNDGLLNAYTAVREDFTDNRSFTYSPFARRLVKESFNVASGQQITNNYTLDNGQSGKLGILTSVSTDGQSWSTPSSGGLDSFSRVVQEQNTILNRPATGKALGAGSVSALLDGKPVDIQFAGAESDGRWRANLGLTTGSHTLRVAAVHPSGQYTAYATNSFTVSGSADTIQNQYDGNGNITKRVWVSSGGVTNRIQTLTWDAFDRLLKVSDRDAQANGFDFVSVYDGLGRRLRTISTMVVSNTLVTNPSSTVSVVDSWYDPEVEFLELGVVVDGLASVKRYGPDGNGIYGGLNGVGGLETDTPLGQIPQCTAINDFFGNVIGCIENGAVEWRAARLGSYGPAPGYSSPSLSANTHLDDVTSWRGKRIDPTGFIYLGARHYDPTSGRFLSADPLGHGVSLDLYSAFDGDPANRFDADGRAPTPFGNRRVTPFQSLFPATAAAMGAKPFTGSVEGDVRWVHGNVYPLLTPVIAPGAILTSEPVQRGAQVIGGASEMVAGAYAIPGSGGIATVAGIGAIAHGLDSVQAGFRGEQSFTAQGFTYLTGSPVAGNLLDGGTGIGLNFTAGLLSSARANSSITHLTSMQKVATIETSEKLGTYWGLFGLNSSQVPASNLGRNLKTLVGGDLSGQIVIPSSAVDLFSAPKPVGPVSALRNMLGIRSAPLGSIDLNTGAFNAGEIFQNNAFRQADAWDKFLHAGHQGVLDYGLDSFLHAGRLGAAYSDGVSREDGAILSKH